MKRSTLVAAALAAVVFAAPARSQGMLPFSVEARTGLAFPTGEFGDGLALGYGLGASAIFNVTPTLGVYGGYSYTQFDFDDDVFGDVDDTFDVQGFDAGARLGLPMAGLSPYLRGGVVYYKAGDAGNELGFQVGAGLDYRLGPVVSFTPEVSYVTVPVGEGRGPDASFVRADVGLRFRL
ncbi:MAG TPA: outer membrane beta-barrel protein [Longimicrobiaceae bacterium]|nr:outer membrane beta-barrel protein [Longimicrobiaceae bacterium]